MTIKHRMVIAAALLALLTAPFMSTAWATFRDYRDGQIALDALIKQARAQIESLDHQSEDSRAVGKKPEGDALDQLGKLEAADNLIAANDERALTICAHFTSEQRLRACDLHTLQRMYDLPQAGADADFDRLYALAKSQEKQRAASADSGGAIDQLDRVEKLDSLNGRKAP